MKKIILKAKIDFKSELNLKNLSKINFEEKIISNKYFIQKQRIQTSRIIQNSSEKK